MSNTIPKFLLYSQEQEDPDLVLNNFFEDTDFTSADAILNVYNEK